MAGVPFIFGNATTSIPLTNLDANFNTGLTIGNTTVGLGNTVTTLGNVTLNNANFGAVANAVIYTNSGGNVTSNASVFSVNGTNVGIGTASPGQKLDISTSGDIQARIGNSVTGSQFTYDIGRVAGSGLLQLYGNQTTATGYIFSGIDGERMRVDTSGSLLLGSTAQTASGASKLLVKSSNPTSGYCADFLQSSANGGTYYFQSFWVGAGTQVGNINSNGTITIYATTSDYRAKTVIGSVENAGQRIDALEPIEYDWNTGGRTRGFLAHKFAEVYPNSVNGEKDAVNKDGKPIYQSMQAATSEVVADLIAEIQSLRKRVAQLESK